jgi:AcrR family transcriptional regulator
MPRATRAQSEATAAAVLETARARFSEAGFAAVTLDEVATAAGVTRGAVYHHYGSKRGLFEAVLAGVHAEIAARVEQDAVGDAWEQLERGCRAFLDASVAPAVRRLLLVEAPAVLGWETWRAQDADASGRLLLDALRAVAAGDALAPVPLEATAALLSGAMNEAALWAAAQADPVAAADEAWRSLAVLLAGLRSSARTRPGPATPRG